MKRKVLVITASPTTSYGISSVILEHQRSKFWKYLNCHLLKINIEGLYNQKLSFFKSSIKYIFLIPFSKMVHIHLNDAASVKIFFLFFKLAQFWKKPVIVNLHEFKTESTLKGKDKSLYGCMLKNSDKVVVLSNHRKKQVKISLNIEEEKICIIPNPYPIARFNEINLKKKNQFSLRHVSNLWNQLYYETYLK